MRRWIACVGFAVIIALASGSRTGLAADPSNSSPKQSYVIGRLLDEGDKPLEGATVRPIGVSTGPSIMWGGASPPGFPDHVVIDNEGTFSLSRAEPFVRLQIHIEATNVGSGDLWLDAGKMLNVVHLGPFQTKKPPAQSIDPATGHPRPTPPYSEWTNAPADPGATSVTTVGGQGHVVIKLCPWPPGKTNSSLYAGAKRLKLAGQVRNQTGEPLPKELQVRVMSSWGESVQVEPGSDGRFEFDGVPAGWITVSTEPGMEMSHDRAAQMWPMWKGWRLSARNLSRRMMGQSSDLAGQLEKDKNDLLLLIEWAEVSMKPRSRPGVPIMPYNQPLWGAETSGPPFLKVTGQILDERTDNPVPVARVIPCRTLALPQPPTPPQNPIKDLVGALTKKSKAPMGPVLSDLQDDLVASNGAFAVEFAPITLPSAYMPMRSPSSSGNKGPVLAQRSASAYLPVLRFEAKGYEPLETEPIGEATNLVIRLTPAVGAAGVVLRSDGRPALGATVVFAGADSLVTAPKRQLQGEGGGCAVQVTGPDGKFEFEAGSSRTVFAADPSGWAEKEVDESSGEIELRLKPWAVLKGKLIATNGTPAAQMDLVLVLCQKQKNGAISASELARTTTDTNGGFEFVDVPPRRLALQHVKAGGRFDSSRPYLPMVPKPGITNDLGKVDSDPPPSTWEMLKQTIGF